MGRSRKTSHPASGLRKATDHWQCGIRRATHRFWRRFSSSLRRSEFRSFSPFWIYLAVETNNTQAIQFYEHLGWAKVTKGDFWNGHMSKCVAGS
jgi:hypothetical protein